MIKYFITIIIGCFIASVSPILANFISDELPIGFGYCLGAILFGASGIFIGGIVLLVGMISFDKEMRK